MNNKMVIEKMYADKKAYVEKTLKAMLMPMYDFGNIQYARDTVTNEEYVKFVEADGYPRYINVTGNNESAIGKEVCRMDCNQTTTGSIKVREKQIEINKLFGGM